MKFIGRNAQLKKLNKAVSYTTKHECVQTVLIYGRRRVGKSELVKHLIKTANIPSIYYECKQVSEASNVQGICNIIAEKFNLPKLGYKTIEEVLEFIFHKACKENMILVLDEYSYLRENIKGIDSIIQSLIDKYRESAKNYF